MFLWYVDVLNVRLLKQEFNSPSLPYSPMARRNPLPSLVPIGLVSSPKQWHIV